MTRYVLAFTIAILFACGLTVAAKQSATAQMGKDVIRQGSRIEVSVTLDKAPNTAGRVYAELTPEGEKSAAASVQSETIKGQTTVTLVGTMTLEAKLGKWSITKMQYFPEAAQSGHDLSLSGDLSFQVVPHEDISVPSAATVSQIK
jgi:hypothetical protein